MMGLVIVTTRMTAVSGWKKKDENKEE